MSDDEFEVRRVYESNHRTDGLDVRTDVEPAPVAGSIKALAQRVLTRGSTSNSASNHVRTERFEGHRTDGGPVRTEVRTNDDSSKAQGYSDRTDRTSNYTSFGKGYRHPDGRVETGQPEPTPRPVAAWPADLNALLLRVATAFEWSDTDRRDFVAWARRSPEGLADARAFLEHEAAKLPAPGLSDRRRAVLDMLKADPALRAAWTCADTGGDPVVLTLAVRGAGTCELAIPREHFDALGLPGLINRLADPLHAKIGGAA